MAMKNNGWTSRTGFRPLTEYLEGTLEDSCQDSGNAESLPNNGLTTGFLGLDQLSNGLRAGSLTVIGGRIAMGTTSLALSIAQRVALEQRKSVAIFSLDFDGEETSRRLLSSASGVDQIQLCSRRLNEASKARLESAEAQLRKASVFIDDTAIGVSEMHQKLQSLIGSGVTPDLVIVDTLQVLAPDLNADEQTRSSVRAIKALGQATGVPVILTTNLLRRVEKRADKFPQWNDVPGGVITGGADLVMLVFREEYYSNDPSHKGGANIVVMRNRHGRSGSVDMSFRADCCRFEG
jgi:replicative DNA helicase